ncbi:hypothetical protein BDZ89DRAFT_1249207 [Hymenopellis radicata]|nr:hypothetical protein BDZ89DRAFT_1249207 [Hymenopellis radicata]
MNQESKRTERCGLGAGGSAAPNEDNGFGRAFRPWKLAWIHRGRPVHLFRFRSSVLANTAARPRKEYPKHFAYIAPHQFQAPETTLSRHCPIVESRRPARWPKTVSYEEQAIALRSQLADVCESEEEWSRNMLQSLVYSTTDKAVLPRFKLCQARLSDYGRKFLEAAGRHHELSYVGEIDEEERHHVRYILSVDALDLAHGL